MLNKLNEWVGDFGDWYYKNHMNGVSETHAIIALVILVGTLLTFSASLIATVLYALYLVVT